MLRIEKLYKKYNRKGNALDGLDMKVEKGDLYGFVGPNGAGKTTTLRIITGLLRPDAGEIWLDGQKTTKDMKLQKSRIGFVPDFFGLYENLTVMEYLEFFAASYGIFQKAGTVRSYEVLELVNLRGMEDVFVDEMSRGMQQKLCLARALLNHPRLLVLDEPNSGLDPRTRKEFQLLLQQLQKEGYTILISSHILSELSDICTSIGIINQGRMVLQGKIDHIMLSIDSSNPLRITVLNKVEQAVRLIRSNPLVERISVEENKIAAWFSGSREEEARLLKSLVEAGILVVAFAREQNSLESLFFHLTGGTQEGEEHELESGL
ncbi:MAG TPA: ABC transporter ATP-binding protein [Candidatus Fusicatenibacter merdavium]|uniref:ABC transporter ATP-binding protein n=1 Tax=Candidatus Fusicatenibacter merdavium TaxID=2838600 RepID=A0A9D1XCM4_9FIRM|nr:ABC transporter ATP-binding protein [Candidatus Fusicatenibacter merdavium]